MIKDISLIDMVTIPKAFPPERVMGDSEKLRINLMDYFTLLKAHDLLPTPPGLATHIGLRGFDSLLHIMRIEEDQPGTYPKDSMDCLELAKSYIEDAYIQGGLRDAFPPQFTKFLLSAFFNRKEKTSTEIQQDTNINFRILGLNTPTSDKPKVVPETTNKKEDFLS